MNKFLLVFMAVWAFAFSTALGDGLLLRAEEQTISFDELPVKTYGNPAFELSASSSSGLPVSYMSSNPLIASISGNVVTIHAAGSVEITASQEGDENFSPAEPVVRVLTVNPAILVISAVSSSVPYGNYYALTMSFSGLVNGDGPEVVGQLPQPFVMFGEQEAGTLYPNVGTYPISFAGPELSAENYIVFTQTGTLEITKADLYCIAGNYSKAQGDPNPELLYYFEPKATLNGDIENDNVIDVHPTISTPVTVSTSAGVYPITLTGGSDNNYNLILVNGTFTVTGVAPNQYVASPANHSGNHKTSITATARAVSGASQYTIELSPLETFDEGTVVSKTGGRSQSFSGLEYNRGYFLRVKTDVQPYYGKVTVFYTGAPEQFTYMINPRNGKSDVELNTTVYSSIVEGAASYTIELNTDQAFAPATAIVKTGSRGIRFTDLLPETTYFCRVRTDLTENWGPMRTFTTKAAETLQYVLAPANGATEVAWNPRITVSDIGASGYTLQLSTSSDFSSNVLEFNSATTRFDVAGLDYNTEYFTRVSSSFSATWGPVRRFTTNTPLNLSYVASPRMAATGINYEATITSRLVPDASQYTIQLSTTDDFSGDVVTATSSSKSIRFSLDYNTTYFARVSTDLLPGQWGGKVIAFTTGDPASFAYVRNPADNAIDIPTSVTVYANLVSNATSYTIELNTSPDFSGTAIVKTSPSRGIVFTGLTPNTSYFTRVKTNLSDSWGESTYFITEMETSALSREGAVVVVPEFRTILKAYPNPFSNALTVHVSGEDSEVQLSLQDLSGRTVYQTTSRTNVDIEIVQPLPSGIYLLKAQTNRGFEVRKIARE